MDIIIPNSHIEAEQFADWLRSQGHTVTVSSDGDADGAVLSRVAQAPAYVDGRWTATDEDARETLNDLWEGYCRS